MAYREVLTPELLRQLLSYDPDTGEMVWRPRPPELCGGRSGGWNKRFAGRPALAARNHHGYLIGAVFAKFLSAHRAAWALFHGEWPPEEIDHINGVRHDNRIANLRAVSRLANHRNKKTHTTNTSGVSGVSWCTKHGGWNASICDGERRVYLGRYLDKADAAAARKAAEKDLGYHPNHGRPG